MIGFTGEFHKVEHVHRNSGGEALVLGAAFQLAGVEARPVEEHAFSGVPHVLHLDFDVDEGPRRRTGEDVQAAGFVGKKFWVKFPVQELQGGDFLPRRAVQHGVAERHEHVPVFRSSEDPLEDVIVHAVDGSTHQNPSFRPVRSRACAVPSPDARGLLSRGKSRPGVPLEAGKRGIEEENPSYVREGGPCRGGSYAPALVWPMPHAPPLQGTHKGCPYPPGCGRTSPRPGNDVPKIPIGRHAPEVSHALNRPAFAPRPEASP